MTPELAAVAYTGSGVLTVTTNMPLSGRFLFHLCALARAESPKLQAQKATWSQIPAN